MKSAETTSASGRMHKAFAETSHRGLIPQTDRQG